MEIRILRRQGKSLREIASEAAVAANTVREYLADETEHRADPMRELPASQQAQGIL